jgi:hypothetical protein
VKLNKLNVLWPPFELEEAAYEPTHLCYTRARNHPALLGNPSNRTAIEHTKASNKTALLGRPEKDCC